MRLALVIGIALIIVGCSGSGDDPAPTATTAALDLLPLAFDGQPSLVRIKPKMDKAMDLYGLERTDENYSRAGSALVALRQEYGVSELDILDRMILLHVPGTPWTFPDAAGVAAFDLVNSR